MDYTNPPKEILNKILDLLFYDKSDIISSDEVDFHSFNISKYNCQLNTEDIEIVFSDEKVKDLLSAIFEINKNIFNMLLDRIDNNKKNQQLLELVRTYQSKFSNISYNAEKADTNTIDIIHRILGDFRMESNGSIEDKIKNAIKN